MSFVRSICWCAIAWCLAIHGVTAGEPAKSTAPVETDTRLHADGKGWRVDRAKISDAKRPRVLLIGDSILNGYLKAVVPELEGKAYVDAGFIRIVSRNISTRSSCPRSWQTDHMMSCISTWACMAGRRAESRTVPLSP